MKLPDDKPLVIEAMFAPRLACHASVTDSPTSQIKKIFPPLIWANIF